MLVIHTLEECRNARKELQGLAERLAHLREKYRDEPDTYVQRAEGLEGLYGETAEAIRAYEAKHPGILHVRDPRLIPTKRHTAMFEERTEERARREREPLPMVSSDTRLWESAYLNLDEILADAVACGATDIIVGGGEPPSYRIGGEFVHRGDVPMEDAKIVRMFYEVLTPNQIERLEREFQVDVSLSRGADYRFRLNLFYRSTGLAAVIRPITMNIPSPDDLGVTQGVMRLLERATGLIVVAGRVGTGKSTLCASFLEYLNKMRSVHIVTLEDPIEFQFTPKRAIITQREMKEHAISFESALKGILRQSPDVIYVGELRDMDTISATLSVAETGHLVLANLHTANSVQTIHRVVDVFPPSQRGLINVQLANSLTAVICQSLLPRMDGQGLVCAREVMISNAAIANLIRKNELHQLYSAMESGGTADTRTMERALAELYANGVISLEVARSHAPEIEALERHVDRLMELQKGRPAKRF